MLQLPDSSAIRLPSMNCSESTGIQLGVANRQGSKADGHDVFQACILHKHSYGEVAENHEERPQCGWNSNWHLSNVSHGLHLPVPHNRWWLRLPFNLLWKKRWPRPEGRHTCPGFIPKDVVTWVCHRIDVGAVWIKHDIQFLFLQYLKFRCFLAIRLLVMNLKQWNRTSRIPLQWNGLTTFCWNANMLSKYLNATFLHSLQFSTHKLQWFILTFYSLCFVSEYRGINFFTWRHYGDWRGCRCDPASAIIWFCWSVRIYKGEFTDQVHQTML